MNYSGSPSMIGVTHLAEDGIIVGLPALASTNIHRAYDIYGVHPGYVRGKMTQRPISRVVIDDSLIMEHEDQCLYTDVMHIDANKFLVTVTDPLQLTLRNLKMI